MASILTIPEIEANELGQLNFLDFWKTEVIVFRSLFNDDFFRNVQHELEVRIAILEQKYELKEKRRSLKITDLSQRMLRLIAKDETLQGALYDVMTVNVEVIRCAINPLILQIMRLLLSEDLSLFHKQILLMSEPRKTWHLSKWHQDHYFNGGPLSTLTTYIPLQSTGKNNGGLMLVPFRKRGERKIYKHKDNDHKTRWNAIDEEEIQGMEGVQMPDLERGDMLVFSSSVPHSPTLNKSTDIRFVLNFRYQDLNASDFLSRNWKIGDLTNANSVMKKASK